MVVGRSMDWSIVAPLFTCRQFCGSNSHPVVAVGHIIILINNNNTEDIVIVLHWTLQNIVI